LSGATAAAARQRDKPVLRNAGVFDVFDTKTDGEDLVKESLAGKPDPAILIDRIDKAHRCGRRCDREGGDRSPRWLRPHDRNHSWPQRRYPPVQAGAQLVVHDLAELV